MEGGSVAHVAPIVWLESIDRAPWLVEHVIAAEADDHGIGIGDINGDGRLDIVTKHGWYEAPPKPAKEKWTHHPDYENPYRTSQPILVIDVNGDKLNDLIAGNGHGYGLYWYEQRCDKAGRRTFVPHAIEEHYAQFHTMVLADMNGDGKLDLLTGKRLMGHDGRDGGEWDPLFMFWYDIAGGKFERHVIFLNNLQYYPGLANANDPPQYAPGTGMRITVGDVDGDGRSDIVVSGRGGLYVFFHRGMTPRLKSANPKVPMSGEKPARHQAEPRGEYPSLTIRSPHRTLRCSGGTFVRTGATNHEDAVIEDAFFRGCGGRSRTVDSAEQSRHAYLPMTS